MSDILVLGTGIAGKPLIALLNAHPARASFSFAIAGRSKAKLDAIATELKLPEEVQKHVVDVEDPASIERAVATTKIVLNTVGSFWQYGTPVVKACVEKGVHYLDLCGETHQIKTLIKDYTDKAKKSGSVVVPGCGMMSLPSDLFPVLAQTALATPLGQSLSAFKLDDDMSGGTVHTTLALFDQNLVRKDILKETLEDPYFLSPIEGKPVPRRSTYKLPMTGIVGGVSPMARFNSAVVRMSWGLRETDGSLEGYGKDFAYDEFFAMPNRFAAAAFSFGFGMFVSAMQIGPLQRLAARLAPPPGTGPSTEEQWKKGSLEVTNVTQSASDPHKYAVTTFKGQGSPGYYLACLSLIECGLLVLRQVKDVDGKPRPGVWTPSIAFGGEIVERLESTGKFEFETKVVRDDER